MGRTERPPIDTHTARINNGGIRNLTAKSINVEQGGELNLTESNITTVGSNIAFTGTGSSFTAQTLAVTNSSTFNGPTTFNNPISVNGQTTVSNVGGFTSNAPVIFNNGATVAGTSTFNGAIVGNGTANFNNQVNFNDPVFYTDVVTFSGNTINFANSNLVLTGTSSISSVGGISSGFITGTGIFITDILRHDSGTIFLGTLNSSGVLINQDAGANITRVGGGTTTGDVYLGGGTENGQEIYIQGDVLVNQNTGNSTTLIGGGNTTGGIFLGGTGNNQIVSLKSGTILATLFNTGTVNIGAYAPNVNVNIGTYDPINGPTVTIKSLVSPVDLLDAATKKYLIAKNKYKDPVDYVTSAIQAETIIDDSDYIGTGREPGRLVCNNASGLPSPLDNGNFVGKRILIRLSTSPVDDSWKQGIYILESDAIGSWSFIRSSDMNGEIYNDENITDITGIVIPAFSGVNFTTYMVRGSNLEIAGVLPLYTLHGTEYFPYVQIFEHI